MLKMNINRDIIFKTAERLVFYVNFGGMPYGFECIWPKKKLDPSFLCQKIGIPVFSFKHFGTCRALKISGFTTDHEMKDGNVQWTVFEGQ